MLAELKKHMVEHIYETLTEELYMSDDEAKEFAKKLSHKLVM